MKGKIKFFAAAGITLFLLHLCIYYWPTFAAAVGAVLSAMLPLAIGAMAAYVLNLVLSFYERHFFTKSRNKYVVALRRPVCIIAAIVSVLAAIALVVILVVPQLVSCVRLIIAKVPDAFANVMAYVAELNIISEETLAGFKSINWEGMIEKIFSALTVGIGGAMNVAVQVVTSVFSGIVTALLSAIFAVYILASKDKIGRQLKRTARQYISEKWYNKLAFLRRILDECFHKYIVGQCVEAVILGTLCAVGMFILGLPYAPMISALIAFTALIPVAGAYIGAGLGAFIILIESPVKAIIFIIFIIVLQQLEGNLIYPKVVGTSVGLPAIWVLAAVTVGGGIMGVLGMLLSVPVAAAIYRLIRHDVCAREAKNKKKSQPSEA